MSKRTHTVTTDGVVTSEFPFTFREDLLADIEQEWMTFVIAAFPAGLPSTIEEYDSRFDPGAAAEHALKESGLNQGQINALPPPLKVVMTAFMRKALETIWYHHQKIPGVDSDTMDSP